MLDILSQKFLQGISTKGAVSDEDIAKEAVAIFGENAADDAIRLINRKLDPLNLTLKSVNCELTGKKYWVFTANVVDKVMTFPGKFTPVQLEFVRKVFSEIIDSEEGYVSTMTCINVRAQMSLGLSPSDAENMLDIMVQQKWLDSKEGMIYMGVRSIGGLMSYFKDSCAENLNVCPMCADAVFHGYRCENCQAVSHLYCLAKGLKIQKNLKCMACDARVLVENLAGLQPDDSMEVDEETATPVKSSKSKKGHSKRRS